MELFTGIIASAAMGYLVTKLERIESKLANLEKEILVIKFRFPKRKDDAEI